MNIKPRPDIVLVKPGSQKELYGELSAFKLTAVEPPLWAALLAGFLRGLGFAVELIDAEIENIGPADTAQRIYELNPVLACVVVSGTNPSASTMNMQGAGAIVARLKELDARLPSMLLGLHPSALPERTMREEACDFVCQGEGFATLPGLIAALKAGVKDFSKIQGLYYRADGHVIYTPRPEQWEDLSTLPRPAWDLLPIKRYRAHNWHCFDDIKRREPYGVIYTSLGCPFRCNFCCISTLFGKHAIRYRPVEQVVEEIDWLVNERGVRNIKIIDEMFALNETRVSELCDLIISRGYDLNFWAYARVNTVSLPMLTKMKQAGINWVAYGFESGSKRVLKDATKGYNLDSLDNVVQMTKDLGIYICANFIFGLPEDDYESMHETNRLMQDINAEWANIYSAMAYPGSKLYDTAVQNAWPLPKSWPAFSQYSAECLPLPTKYLSGGQVLAFRDYAFDAYYKSPRYLNMIKAKFGEDTARHIIEMAAKPLKRNHAEPF